MQSDPANKDRFLVAALRTIAAERAIEFASFSHDWIIRLRRDAIAHFIYGYNFDFNPAAAALIANDKSALATVLEQHEIPHVEHTLFLAPYLSKYLGSGGNWPRALRYAESIGYPLVCKTNQGTRGSSVFKIYNQTELEAAFQKIHNSARGLSLSPFYSIDAEYRTILLKSNVLLCYRKERPHVTGDGRSNFFELVQANGSPNLEMMRVAFSEPSFPLDQIPEEGQKIPLVWKHNLSKGAMPRFELDPAIKERVVTLAQAACSATGMQFAAIDVIETNGDLKVIEVNAGICLEQISQISEKSRTLAFDVYAHAVDVMFGLEKQR